MAKPAGGTALDTGHALYTNLVAAWAMLEGSGSTTADSLGTRTGTFSGGNVTWSTVSGEPVVNVATGAGAAPISFTTLAISNASDWSLFFRLRLTGATDSFILGKGGSDGGVRMESGISLDFRNSGGTQFSFTSETTFTTLGNYLLTYKAGSSQPLRLYRGGSEVASSPITQSNAGVWDFNSIGNGFDTSSFLGKGDYSTVYAWTGRLLTGTDAATLEANPWALFQSAAPGVATPTSLLHSSARMRAANY